MPQLLSFMVSFLLKNGRIVTCKQNQRQLMCIFRFAHKFVIIVTFPRSLLKNQPVDDYLRALIREWELLDIKELRTLYIGGGTPTAISAEQLHYLLSHLQKNLDLSKLEEFTIEANPGDLTVDKIKVLKNLLLIECL